MEKNTDEYILKSSVGTNRSVSEIKILLMKR
jgi:hypothetical protein